MESLSIKNDDAAIKQQVTNWRPNIVLLSCARDEVKEKCLALLNVLSDLRVLAIIDNGREASICELRPHETRIGPMSPESLIETIRDVAATGTDE